VDSRVLNIDLLRFLARYHIRRLNQAVSIGFFVCILFIRATFVLTLVCVGKCSVFWLLLVKLSVLAMRLA